MTCKKCRYEFCWLCKRNWKGHGGGYYSCKKYKKEASNVAKILKQIEDNQEPAKFGFLTEALSNLVAGYRCLQWSYCLTYFLSAGPIKKLFLFQQKDLAKICSDQKKKFGDGTKVAAKLLEMREDIIRGSRQIKNIIRGCNEHVEKMVE